jgi:hypothetical protein
MRDLISRGDLIASIDCICSSGGIWGEAFEAYKKAFKKLVEDIPSAEPPSDLKGIEIVRIKDIPEIHTVEASYVENYEDAIRKPPGAWKNELFPKILDGIDRCLKITCEKDRQTNNWIFTAKMHMIHPDELFLTVRNENAKEESRWIPVTQKQIDSIRERMCDEYCKWQDRPTLSSLWGICKTCPLQVNELEKWNETKEMP